MSNTDLPSKRLLKVYYQHYAMCSSPVLKPYPVIRIGGLYLTALNFDIGDTIEVTLENEKITIAKVHPSSAEKTTKPDI